MRHNGIGETVSPHVGVGIRGLGCPQPKKWSNFFRTRDNNLKKKPGSNCFHNDAFNKAVHLFQHKTMLLFFPQQRKCGVKRAKNLFITHKQYVCHNINARFQWSLLVSQPADANLSLHPAIKPPLPNHRHDHQWGWESMFWPLYADVLSGNWGK